MNNEKLKMHYDVGIYGWWGHENFGGCLGYFALERAVKKLGYSVLMIQEAKGLPGRYTIPSDSIAMSFANKVYDHAPQCDIVEMGRFNNVCDKFIVGGDQLWNEYIHFSKEDCFLSFVNDEKLKISYGTAFGQKNYMPSEQYLATARPLLQKFDAVSVREDYAMSTARRYYNVAAKEVVDAMFLLSKEDYEKELKKFENPTLPSKYLLAYLENPISEKRRQVEAISKKLGLEIICVPDIAQSQQDRMHQAFEGLNFLNPISVPNIIKAFLNAEYVVTDSYYGTGLCIVFGKNFNTFTCDPYVDHIVSLLEAFSLSSRQIDCDEPYDKIYDDKNIGEGIDWPYVWQILDYKKKDSLNWLGQALKNKRVISEEEKQTNEFFENLIESQNAIRQSINNLNYKVNQIKTDVEAFDGHYKLMFWELYKKPEEEMLDAKKRFFKSLSTNDEFMKLKQRGNKILLKKFAEICSELKLDYWMCAGSLLGIVRHGGFIPWDDDIDVTMPRKDYDKFVEHVMKNEKDFTMVYWFNINMGDVITKLVFKNHVSLWFLDIYPCDEIRSNNKVAAQAYLDFKHRMIAEIRSNSVIKPILREMSYDVYLEQKYRDALWGIFKKYNEEFFAFLKQNCWGDEPIGYVCSLEDPEDSMVQVGNYQMNEDVYPLVEKMYEDIPVKVIKNYDEYLEDKYGDIYTLPKDIFTHIHIKDKLPSEEINKDNKFLEQFKEA